MAYEYNVNSIAYPETSTALTASQVFTGATRDSGVGPAQVNDWAQFNIFVSADQAGSYQIQGSDDGATWMALTLTTAYSAGARVFAKVPVVYRYNRVVVTNGATADTITFIRTSYSAV